MGYRWILIIMVNTWEGTEIMLQIKILNDATGDDNIANYIYTVMINNREIAKGEIKNHNRKDGWKKLTKKIIKDKMMIETDLVNLLLKEFKMEEVTYEEASKTKEVLIK